MGLGATWAGTVVTNVGEIFNHGQWTGNIDSNDDHSIYNDGASAVWWGSVANNSQVINTNGAQWQGAVVENNGGCSNNLTLIDNFGAWVGAVQSNFASMYNETDATWLGDVVSNGVGGRILNETGGSWNGDVTGNAGTIANLGVWTGSFTSAGTVKAENRINGAFTNSGLLQLTGSLASITTLTNNRTLELRGSGPAQTLIATNVNFGAGSIYGIDINSAGQTDTIVATTASLGGTVQVKAAVTGAPYNATSHYVILSAPNFTGTFDGVTTDLGFLDPRLSYADPQVVALDLVRNDQGFGQVGQTPNQKGTTAAAEALGAGRPIYGAILWLTEAQAAQAFDALSGEAYPSLGLFDPATWLLVTTPHLVFAGRVDGAAVDDARDCERALHRRRW